MDIRSSWREMQLVIALVSVLAAGCTEGVGAHIRIAAHDNSKVDHYLRVELEKLGWTEKERLSTPRQIFVYYRHDSDALRSYFIRIHHGKGKAVEILFAGIAQHYFTCEAVDAYRSLVARLQADPDNEVKYDVQTSSGQWIMDNGIVQNN